MGTRLPVKTLAVCSKDHPHACGDKEICVAICELCVGSSPRVWGQVFFYAQQTAALRIIPTRVGTSKAMLALFALKRDHPHACGDKFFLSHRWNNCGDHPHACGDKEKKEVRTVRIVGSSPRVWGQV